MDITNAANALDFISSWESDANGRAARLGYDAKPNPSLSARFADTAASQRACARICNLYGQTEARDGHIAAANALDAAASAWLA